MRARVQWVVDELRRRTARPRASFKKHEGIVQWLCLLAIAIAAIQSVQDARTQGEVNRQLIARLDARQNALCVAVKDGRAVFKQVVDQNGLIVATRVSIIDCPGAGVPHQ